VVDDDRDDDGWALDDDCDDANPNVHPGAAEQCLNGIDDDCNTVIDQCDLCSQNVTSVSYGWTGSLVAVDMLETSDESAAWVVGGTDLDVAKGPVIALRSDASSPHAWVDFDAAGIPEALATHSDLDGDAIDDLAVSGTAVDGAGAAWVFSSPIPDGGTAAEQADTTLIGWPNRAFGKVYSVPAIATTETGPMDALIVADAVGAWLVQGPLSANIDLSTDTRVRPVADRPYIAAATDFDGDGTNDMILGGADATETAPPNDGAIRVFLGPLAAESLDATTDDLAWVDPGDIGSGLATGDFDGDGRDDAFATGSSCLTNEICELSLLTYESPNGPYIEASSATVTGSAAFALAVLAADDFDIDGVADLVVGEPYEANEKGWGGPSHGRISIISGPFVGVYSLPDDATADVSSCKESWEMLAWDLATGDYDRDGAPDVLAGGLLMTDQFQSIVGGVVRVMPSTSFVEP
jgi:hypothetical protein